MYHYVLTNELIIGLLLGGVGGFTLGFFWVTSIVEESFESINERAKIGDMPNTKK